MRVIDCSPSQKEGNTFSSIITRVQEFLNFGSGQSDARSQEFIISQMRVPLSNKYILLRNVLLKELDIPIPLVLIGPPGVFVMVSSGIKGVFRVKGETWATMHSRTRRFEPARPNLITRAMRMARAVEAFLTRIGEKKTEIHPVLLLSNPGIHVEVTRPAIRIVLVDGLEHFINSLNQTHPLLSNEDVQRAADALVQASTLPPPVKAEAASQPSQQAELQRASKMIPASISQGYVSLSNRVSLSRGQWIFLGITAFIEIAISIMFLVYVLLTT